MDEVCNAEVRETDEMKSLQVEIPTEITAEEADDEPGD